MIIYEMKLKGTKDQYRRLDEAIRTGRFVRNSIIKAWMDGEVKTRNDAYKYCKILSDNPEFPWANKLNSQARQAHAERAWVAIENLKVRNMVKNHNLAKSINDAAWYRFREGLEYFGSIYRVEVIAVDPKYTSQNCSSCSQKVLKSLSTRTHVCPHCGYIADRDENAAINILSKALEKSKTTLGHRESHASGENPLCSVVETLQSKGTRRKRKPS